MQTNELLNYLGEISIDYRLYHHEAVFSVAEADKIDAAIPGTHTRNLFLKDKRGEMFLVTLRSDTKIDLKKLAALLDADRFSFGSPERLQKYLGVTPGSVTPLSIINDKSHEVTLILEEEMMRQEMLNFHPLINTMTVGMTAEALLKFLASSGTEPRIIDLSAAAPD